MMNASDRMSSSCGNKAGGWSRKLSIGVVGVGIPPWKLTTGDSGDVVLQSIRTAANSGVFVSSLPHRHPHASSHRINIFTRLTTVSSDSTSDSTKMVAYKSLVLLLASALSVSALPASDALEKRQTSISVKYCEDEQFRGRCVVATFPVNQCRKSQSSSTWRIS